MEYLGGGGGVKKKSPTLITNIHNKKFSSKYDRPSKTPGGGWGIMGTGIKLGGVGP